MTKKGVIALLIVSAVFYAVSIVAILANASTLGFISLFVAVAMKVTVLILPKKNTIAEA